MEPLRKKLSPAIIQNILQSISERLVIVSPSYDLLWTSESKPDSSQASEIPSKCHEFLFQSSKPCTNCPLSHTNADSPDSATLVTIDSLKRSILVEAIPLPPPSTEYLVTHRDITGLIRDWSYLDTLQRILPLGILLTNEDLKIEYVNPGFFSLFPFIGNSLSGKDLRLVASRHTPPLPKELLDFIFSIPNLREPFSNEFELSLPATKQIEIQGIPFSTNSLRYYLILFLDRTANKIKHWIETQQHIQDEMASLYKSLSHSLIPSLKKIQKLSHEGISSDPKAILKKIGKESAQLLLKLKTLDRHEPRIPGKIWSEMDLHNLIMEVIRNLSPKLQKHKIKLKTRFTHHLKPLIVPGVLMKQCIQAVIDNAVESIEMKVQQQKGPPYTPRIEVITLMNGSTLELTVKDNGMGMDADQLAKACLPNYTTKDPLRHAGMGLFFCETLLRQLGGRFELSSVRGVGAKILMKIPSRSLHIEEFERPSPSVSASTGKKKRRQKKGIFTNRHIWILGEVDASVDVIRKFLLKEGANVKLFRDRDSLEKITPRELEKGACILNVTDMKQTLPYLTVLGEKTLLDKTLVLASEEVMPHLKGRLKNSGVRFLKKPFPMESLVASLTSL